MNCEERRKEIIELLNVKRHESIENLARLCETSPRTIRRDIERLSDLYPLYYRNGKDNGIYLVDGFSIEKRYLSKSEQKLLADLGNVVSGKNKKRLDGILVKFSMPNIPNNEIIQEEI